MDGASPNHLGSVISIQVWLRRSPFVVVSPNVSAKKGLAVSKVVSAMDMRQNFGTLLNQVAIKDEEIVIERAGKPLARLVSMNSATSGKLDFRDIGKLPNDIWVE